MRNHWVAALAVLAFLGGCSPDQGGSNAGKPATPAVAAGTTINGTVTFHDQIPIGAGAKLDVKLVDIVQPEVPVAEKVFEVGGAPPFTFALDFDPAKINPGRTYVVNASLTDGTRHFVPALDSPVLTRGTGTTAQVVLNAEATPAEDMKEEYSKLEGHIGGMRKVAGTYTTDTASIGWDAFADPSGVRFVRLNTVMDAGGRNSVKYAFKDGKPFVVKQQGEGIVGWNAEGAVVLNEKPGGGTIGEGDIKSMRDAAMNALQLAQDKVDAGKKK